MAEMVGTWEILLLLFGGAVLLIAGLRAVRLPTLPAYIVLGLAAGPHGLAILRNTEAASLAAEFGVVLLMFTIGLKFSLPRLLAMRRYVFLLGGAQVAASAALIAAIAWSLGIPPAAALLIGAAAALSSTAIISKTLIEQNEVNTPHGARAVGVLLFQDLAVIPILILIAAAGETGEIAWLAAAQVGLKIALTLVVVLGFGPWLLPRWLDWVERRRSDELFILNLIFVIVLLSWVTHFFGLSVVLGAFLAGILISETLHRFRVEEVIGPFREIFLGFFFVTIGALISPAAIAADPGWILGGALLIIAVKTPLVWALARLIGAHPAASLRVGLLLGGAGEFGFVLLAEGRKFGVIDGDLFRLLLPANLLAMLAAPLLWARADYLVEKLVRRDWLTRAADMHKLLLHAHRKEGHIILCGFGRTGRVMAELFARGGLDYLATDDDSARVENAKLQNLPVVFGDARNSEVLAAAGAAHAAAIVITYHQIDAALKTVREARRIRATAPIVAKAFSREEAAMLLQAGASEAIVEPRESGLAMGAIAMQRAGRPLQAAQSAVAAVRESVMDDSADLNQSAPRESR